MRTLATKAARPANSVRRSRSPKPKNNSSTHRDYRDPRTVSQVRS